MSAAVWAAPEDDSDTGESGWPADAPEHLREPVPRYVPPGAVREPAPAPAEAAR